MTTLLELADRVEAGDGADRLLDGEIAKALAPERDCETCGGSSAQGARAAYLEALTAGWNSGMAREPMDANYAERSWLASDSAAAIAALRPQVEGEGN